MGFKFSALYEWRQLNIVKFLKINAEKFLLLKNAIFLLSLISRFAFYAVRIML